MTDNDPLIKVVIRTPTSVRRGVPHERLRSEEHVTVRVGFSTTENSYENLMMLMQLANVFPQSTVSPEEHSSHMVRYSSIIQQIIEQSMHESGELKRDANIVSDIKSRDCLTTDLDKSCSICQSIFKPKEKLSTLECEHTFHYSCIDEWVKYKSECPLCRKSIPVLER